MKKKKMLFIVGAGASEEAGLPVGSDLKSIIESLLNIRFSGGYNQTNGDGKIYEALRILVQNPDGSREDVNKYINAAWKIRDAMPLEKSIDHYIDTQRGDKFIESCGKLAIVRSILRAEKKSKLFFDSNDPNSNINYVNIMGTWFQKFYQLLTENCSKEELAERFNSVAMVVFNYDRCIEHFLVNSIQTNYKIDVVEAEELVNGIEIYHPYGKVGHLPWQKGNESINFGAEPNVRLLLSISKQIRTFTEGTDPNSSKISDIRWQVESSEKVIFLGFAFHKLNMELLKPDLGATPGGRRGKCFATAKGISDHDCEIIDLELRKLKSLEDVYIRNSLSCVELFQEYERSLSLV